jgi:hypothetical protein
MIRSSLFAFICLFQGVCAFGQLPQNDSSVTRQSISADSVSMPFSTKYKASGSKEFFWGKHYRKEWGTTISFPILDMKTYKGGLTPDKLGGGHQSKSLRVIGGDGKEYVLRTVDKNLDVLIPEDLKGTFLNRAANDQMSMIHPYGAMILAKLSERLSILHVNPEIFYVSNVAELKEFRDTIGNKLCYFEERPSGQGWEHTMLAGNADEIENSEKVLEKFAKDTKYRMDQKELLKVRLLDMMVNDFDRHEDNWTWAAFKKDSLTFIDLLQKTGTWRYQKLMGCLCILLRCHGQYALWKI